MITDTEVKIKELELKKLVKQKEIEELDEQIKDLKK